MKLFYDRWQPFASANAILLFRFLCIFGAKTRRKGGEKVAQINPLILRNREDRKAC